MNKEDIITQPCRVLIADDEPTVRELLADCVQQLSSKHQVSLASDGKQALDLLRRQDFDLFLTDVRMPNIAGTELLDVCRQEFPRMPVVVITGVSTVDVVVQALRLGATNFVPKPFRIGEVLEVLRKALQRRTEIETPRRMLPFLRREELEFSIPPSFEYKQNVLYLIIDRVDSLGFCDSVTRHHLTVALDEALTNAIFYGCFGLDSNMREEEDGMRAFTELVQEKLDAPQYAALRIEVHCLITPEKLQISVKDPGKGFDYTKLPSALDPEDLLRPRGRGIMLMRCFMDEVSFRGKGNELVLVKHAEAGVSTTG